jgi:hypothetical protein
VDGAALGLLFLEAEGSHPCMISLAPEFEACVNIGWNEGTSSTMGKEEWVKLDVTEYRQRRTRRTAL